MILHLVHIENAKIAALIECLKYADEKDAIVILFEACSIQTLESIKKQCTTDKVPVHFLKATDNAESYRSGLPTISYSVFVDLCCSSTKVQSWY